MQKYKLITTLRFLEIHEPIDKCFTLMPGIDLITDRKKIKKIIDKEFLGIAGRIETNHILNSNHILYCEADEKIFDKNCSSNQALIIWLLWLDMLINDSWLVKDNALACEIAFCKMSDGKQSEWSSNYLSHQASLSTGEQYKTTTYNMDELIEWESQCHKVQSYLHNKNSGALASFTNKQYSRIGRARHFITAARREPHPAIKISHYCSAFESLFSTDNTELSHKLSERVALFLKKNNYNPIPVFDDMKLFYGVRSKVTHGDSIQESKEKELSKLSSKCDSYLRSIFCIILNDTKMQEVFDGKKDEFERFFKELLFLH